MKTRPGSLRPPVGNAQPHLLDASRLLLSPVPPAFARIENPVIGTAGTTDFGQGFAIILANLWKGMVSVGAIMFVLYFAWGALGWLMAGGDKAKLEEARQRITNGLIGLIILAGSVAIVEILGGILNLPFLENLSFIFPEA